MKKNEIKIGTQIEGEISYKLIDTRTGKVDQEGKQKNCLLNGYLNRYFTHGTALLDSYVFGTLYLGDGTTAADRSQTGLQGNELGSSDDKIMTKEFGSTEELIFTEINAFAVDELNDVKLSSDESMVALKYRNYYIKCYDIADSNQLFYITGQHGGFNFSNDSTKFSYCYTVDDVTGVRVRNISDWSLVGAFTEHTVYDDDYYIRGIEFFSDDTYIVTWARESSGSYVVRIWDSVNFTTQYSCAIPDYIKNIKISSDDSIIYIFAGENLFAWDYSADTTTTVISGLDTTSGNLSIVGNFAFVGAVRIDLTTGEQVFTFPGTIDTPSFNNKLISYYDYDLEAISFCDINSGGVLFAKEFPSRRDDSIRAAKGTIIVYGNYWISNCYVYNITKPNEITEKSMTVKWTFEPGAGTGDINEVFLKARSSYYDYAPVARQVLDNTIVKEDYHRLDFEWTIKVKKPTGVFNGTITAGGRDGTTDINYKIFIGNMQFIGLIKDKSILPYFGIRRTAYAVGGSSNEDSDMTIDALCLGKSKGYIVPYEVTAEPYTADSLERSFRIGFNTDQINVDDGVGEILFKDSSDNPVFRITFDPKLDKINTYRLYLDFTFSLDVS